MTDRREMRANGRVAHVALRGQVTARRFVEPVSMRAARPVVGVHARPDGPRDRELVLHEGFDVLEERDGWAFGAATRDGYVGYVRRDALGAGDAIRPTHVVAVRQSYLASEPRLKTAGDVLPISFGTPLEVVATHEDGRWAEVSQLRAERENHKTGYTCYVPTAHLRPLGAPEKDPVTVAERFLGTPYRWAGNSGFGIDCSGLVQAACLACGIACPGDSDQQQALLGAALPGGTPPERGDLLFWPGHVAWVADGATILHANARGMAVAFEPLEAALRRIADEGDGAVTAHKRLTDRSET